MPTPSHGTPHIPAQDAVAHLTPDLWARANRLLIRKGLAEFAHERLLAPKRLPQDGHYAVRSDDGAVEYRFAARRLALDHWQVDADSITRHRGDAELPLDALEFFIELRGPWASARRSSRSTWRRSAPPSPAPPTNSPPTRPAPPNSPSPPSRPSRPA